ncbi:MAG: hypothetical protein OHK0015_26120 [Chloroflexi bacterium OHK40]
MLQHQRGTDQQECDDDDEGNVALGKTNDGAHKTPEALFGRMCREAVCRIAEILKEKRGAMERVVPRGIIHVLG